MSKLYRIDTSYEPISDRDVGELHLSAIRHCFFNAGYSFIQLSSQTLEPFGEIFLPVEIDIEFLLEGYITLINNLKTTTEFEHFCFLGDGVLQINTLANDSEVKVDYEYCPGLEKANLSVISELISLDQYQYFWRRIAYPILDTYTRIK